MSSFDAFLNHPIRTLEKALQIRKQIDQLNEVLKELFGPSPVSLAGVQTTIPKRRGRPRKVENEKEQEISPAKRPKVSATQSARRAKAKAKKPAVKAEEPQREGPSRRKEKAAATRKPPRATKDSADGIRKVPEGRASE